ncbi:MAG: hypothetical protein FIA90_14690 [candidate division NC10 bacterium]|nr:hypothetical protein [candidate division NC10 bacterium]
MIAVRRGGAWIEEFGEIHPKLCEGPLLGTTLSVLTGQASQAQEAESKTTRPGKARFAAREHPPEPKRNRTTSNVPTDSPFRPKTSHRQSVAKRKALETVPVGSSVQALSQLQAQADRLLLSRLVGSVIAFERTEQANIRFSQVKEKHPKEASVPSVCGDPAARQDWLNRLAQRAGKMITQEQSDTTGTATPAQGNAQMPSQSPSLEEQWTMPLDGTCASLDMLDRLVQEDFPGDEGNGGTTQRRPSRSNPSPSSEQPHPIRPIVKADESSQGLDQWDGWRSESASGGNELEPKATPPVTAQAGSPLLALEPGVNGAAGYGVGETKSSAPIIPANVTPSLPDLLPPQRVGAPPLPVAAVAARRGAREEGLKATDDLDMLAAKIKQILDEQARRHGIDV